MRRPGLAALFAGLALLGSIAAACGGGDEVEGDGTERITVDNPAVPPGAAVVDQDNLAFRPKKLLVRPGETVYFVNSESAVHTVTIDGKNESGTMKRNDVFMWTPSRTGEYKITCDFHAKMRATVVVEDAPPQ